MRVLLRLKVPPPDQINNSVTAVSGRGLRCSLMCDFIHIPGSAAAVSHHPAPQTNQIPAAAVALALCAAGGGSRRINDSPWSAACGAPPSPALGPPTPGFLRRCRPELLRQREKRAGAGGSPKSPPGFAEPAGRVFETSVDKVGRAPSPRHARAGVLNHRAAPD